MGVVDVRPATLIRRYRATRAAAPRTRNLATEGWMVNTITMANAGVPVTARRCDLYEKALKGSDELLFDPDDPSQKMTPDRFATVAQGLHLVLWERFNAVSSAVSDPRYLAVAEASKVHPHTDTMRHPLFGRFSCDCRHDAHHSSCEHVLAVRGMDTWKPHHVDIRALVQAHSVRPRAGRPHNVTAARVPQPESPVAAGSPKPTPKPTGKSATKPPAKPARPSDAAAGNQETEETLHTQEAGKRSRRGFGGHNAEQPVNKAAKGSAPFPGTRGGEEQALTRRPRPLRRVGNTCYVNTAAQMLTATARACPGHASFLLNDGGELAVHKCVAGWCVLCAVRETVTAASEMDAEPMEPTRITHHLAALYNRETRMQPTEQVWWPGVRWGWVLLRSR